MVALVQALGVAGQEVLAQAAVEVEAPVLAPAAEEQALPGPALEVVDREPGPVEAPLEADLLAADLVPDLAAGPLERALLEAGRVLDLAAEPLERDLLAAGLGPDPEAGPLAPVGLRPEGRLGPGPERLCRP